MSIPRWPTGFWLNARVAARKQLRSVAKKRWRRFVNMIEPDQIFPIGLLQDMPTKKASKVVRRIEKHLLSGRRKTRARERRRFCSETDRDMINRCLQNHVSVVEERLTLIMKTMTNPLSCDGYVPYTINSATGK
jgi:hypothetical protein